MTKTVLAVDDSPSIRCMVALTLREAGYEVIERRTGRRHWTSRSRGRSTRS